MMFVEVEAGSSERAVSRWGFALPLVPITLSVFCLSALVYYQVQRGGAEPAQGLLQGLVVGLHGLIGFVPAFLLCLMVLTWSSIWFFNGTLERPGARVGRLAAFALSLAILVNLGEGALAAVPPGGAIGEFLAVRFESVLGTGLSTLLVSVAAIASLLLATDYFFYRYFEPLGRPGRSADLRDETGTEAEAAELLSTLPVPDLRALAARRQATAATGPADIDIDIVTGDEATAAIAEADAGDGSGSWRARRRVQRHLRIDDTEPDAEAQAEVGEEASEQEDSEVWEDEEEGVAARGALDDDQGWEEDDDEPVDEDEEEADEAEEEDVDWEEADYEDDDYDDEDDEEEEDEDDEDDEDDEYDEDEDEEEDEDEDDYEDDDFRGFEDEDEDERAEVGAAEPAVAGIVVPDASDSKGDGSDDAGSAAIAASTDEDEPYEIPRPESGVRGRQKSLFADADADVDEHLLDEAARTVIRAHRASVTLLQRRMRVDFQEARALMEDLRRQGVVGGAEGEAHAPVLIDMAAWDAR